MMRLGAHNTIAGGFTTAVEEAKAIGADCLQMFAKNQRQWTAKPIAAPEAAAFRDAVAAAKLGPNMVHDSYLINMGNPDKTKSAAARAAFLDEFDRCEQLGIAYLNFHSGSHVHESAKMRDDPATRKAALDQVADHLSTVLDARKQYRCRLVIENAAGQGSNVGTSWQEVAHILDRVAQPARMGVTIDTQHAWACGYDWVDDYDGVWDDFESAIGRKHLVAFHLNDSKMERGTRVDRHDTMGSGHLGLEFFRTLINDRKLDGCIGILETPEGPESWKKEIALLRSLRN